MGANAKQKAPPRCSREEGKILSETLAHRRSTAESVKRDILTMNDDAYSRIGPPARTVTSSVVGRLPQHRSQFWPATVSYGRFAPNPVISNHILAREDSPRSQIRVCAGTIRNGPNQNIFTLIFLDHLHRACLKMRARRCS